MTVTVEKTNRLKMFKSNTDNKDQAYTLYLNIEGKQYSAQVYKKATKSGAPFYTGPVFENE
jgi:hypothetical protein